MKERIISVINWIYTAYAWKKEMTMITWSNLLFDLYKGGKKKIKWRNKCVHRRN